MRSAVGGLLATSLLLVWGVRLLARKDRDEEEASRLGLDLAVALAREPRLYGAAILPVATSPLGPAYRRSPRGRAVRQRARSA